MTSHQGAPAVLTRREGAVLQVTLNRPAKRNAIDPETAVRLHDTWAQTEEDPAVRAIVLTGAGTTAFCAGADFNRTATLATQSRMPEDEWDRRFLEHPQVFSSALLRDGALTKPVVAAINGHAHGGGAEMLLGTDIRVAADTATFALPEVRRGLIAATGSLSRLPRQIGWAPAMEMLLTGDPIDAETALRVGLVNRVAPAADVLAVAWSIATRIASAGPLAVRWTKEGARRTDGLDLRDAYLVEDEYMRRIVETADAREGPLAFLEGRDPRFLGA